MAYDAPLLSVLSLGDARLRATCEPVIDVTDSFFRAEVRALGRVLSDFRAASGFGRAIAAPQVGIAKRFLVMDLGEGPRLLANPVIIARSDDTFTMWDDCMSFPTLLVRVARHEWISIRYVDESGATRTWERMDRATSELLQHEIDHLNGVLAIDRAKGESPFVTRTMFDAAPARYLAEVDYTITQPPPALESSAD